MNEAQIDLDSALTTARHALEQFRAEPIVASKRGGPRTSPWFRIWKEASEVAARWHRQLEHERPELEIDNVIDRILAEERGEGGPAQ